MFNKKRGVLILLMLVVGVFAISCVSAADNATDTIATDDADEEILETTDNEKILSTENNEIVSKDSSEDVLSGVSVYSYQYSVQIQNGNEISSTKGGKFYYYLKPYTMPSTDNYNFKFEVYSCCHYI